MLSDFSSMLMLNKSNYKNWKVEFVSCDLGWHLQHVHDRVCYKINKSNGNLLVIDLSIDSNRTTLVDIYGPNTCIDCP